MSTTDLPAESPMVGDKYTSRTDPARIVTVTRVWADKFDRTAVAFEWRDKQPGQCSSACPIEVFHRAYEPEAAPATITFDVAAHVLFHADRGGYPAGSFTTKLLDAWNLADDSNAAKLASVFPDYAAAFALLGQPHGINRLRAIAGGAA